MKKLLLILLLWPASLWAQDFPEYQSIYVNDYADLLDPDTENRIADALTALRSETGVEMTVLTIHRRSDYGSSASVERFAKDLFNHWGIGDATRNDGILLLVADEDREMRIALGQAYGPVWDGVALRIIDTEILPAFKSGQMSKGIERGAEAAITRIARKFHAGQLPDPAIDEGIAVFKWVMGAMVAGMFLVFGFIIWVGRFIARQHRICPNCGEKHMTLTKLSPNGGVRVTRRHCPDCNHTDDQTTTITSDNSDHSSSSSSDSFGGGSSSGGGASGRW